MPAELCAAKTSDHVAPTGLRRRGRVSFYNHAAPSGAGLGPEAPAPGHGRRLFTRDREDPTFKKRMLPRTPSADFTATRPRRDLCHGGHLTTFRRSVS